MRLIDADALMECINNIPSSMSVCLSIDECKGKKYMKEKAYMAVFQAPTIDAVPVVHGRWIDESLGHNWYGKCSACGEAYNVDSWYGSFNYCPNCGAKMEEVQE